MRANLTSGISAPGVLATHGDSHTDVRHPFNDRQAKKEAAMWDQQQFEELKALLTPIAEMAADYVAQKREKEAAEAKEKAEQEEADRAEAERVRLEEEAKAREEADERARLAEEQRDQQIEDERTAAAEAAEQAAQEVDSAQPVKIVGGEANAPAGQPGVAGGQPIDTTEPGPMPSSASGDGSVSPAATLPKE